MPSKRKKPAVEEEEEPHEVLARKMAAPNLKQPTLHQTLKQPPAAEEEEDDDDDDDDDGGDAVTVQDLDTAIMHGRRGSKKPPLVAGAGAGGEA